MPRNPLLSVQTNTSKTNVQRPEPVTPVMESIDGQNLAWRGVNVDHGVTPTDKSELPDTYEVDVSGNAKSVDIYSPPEKEENPIPVFVVNGKTAREYRAFWTDRRTVTDGVSSLLGRDDQRVTARIRNMDTTKTVWIASNFGDLAMRGYPLVPGVELTVAGEMPIYVASADGTPVTIGLYVETVIPER